MSSETSRATFAEPPPSVPSVGFEVVPARSAESETLLSWLDAGMREGRTGRLRAEYGAVLDGPGCRAEHVVARLAAAGPVVSHALVRRVDARADGVHLGLGMIGLVFTDPRQRRRGLARLCLEAAVEHLASQGASLAALWSDRHAFYAKSGFHRAGVERSYRFDRRICARARSGLGPAGVVRAPRAADWPRLEALYAAKSAGIRRAPGELRRLASAPDCSVHVCDWEGHAVAYAACGRGDDFGGVAHEWAGTAAGVLACLTAHLADREVLSLLAGPHDEAPARALRRAGAQVSDGCFALIRPIDATAVWRAATRGEPRLATVSARGGNALALETSRGVAALDARASLRLLLGSRIPLDVRAALDSEQEKLLRDRLPVRLFAWGFDSI